MAIKPRFSVWRVLIGIIIGMSIAASVIWDDENHSLSLSTAGVALGAFIVWIVVRATNQWEAWAKWTAIMLLALSGYSLSAAPASRLAHMKGCPSWAIPTFRLVYFPIIWLGDHGPKPIREALGRYFNLWRCT